MKTYQLKEPNFEGHQYVEQFYLDLLDLQVAEAMPTYRFSNKEERLKCALSSLSTQLKDTIYEFVKRAVIFNTEDSEYVSASINMAYFNDAIIKNQIEDQWKVRLEGAQQKFNYSQHRLNSLRAKVCEFNSLILWKRVWRAFKGGI